MPVALFSPAAEKDLEEIAGYIANDKPLAALEFVNRLESQCRWLAQNSDAGFLRDDLTPNLLVWPVGSWLIFYRLLAQDIEVVRVVHGARDLPRLFEGGGSGTNQP